MASSVKRPSSKKSKTAAESKIAAQTKSSTLSEEKVLESDSDADDDNGQAQAKSAHTEVNEQTDKSGKDASDGIDISSEPSSSSEDESEDEAPQNDAEAATTSNTKEAPAKVNGVKRKAGATDSDTSSESESESAQTVSKKARVGREKLPQAERSSKSKGKQPVVNTPENPVLNRPNADPSVLPEIAAPNYLPPDGYRRVPLNEDHAVEESDLDGLELWHITAPVGVPLGELSSLAANAIAEEATVLSHDNLEYTLAEDGEAPAVSIFLPSKNGYKASSRRVSRSLSLRARLDIPVIPTRAVSKNSGSSAAANVATPAVISVRPQPEGLKMRYKPPAFGKGQPGVIGGTSSEEDDTMEDQQTGPTFQFPRAIGPHPDGDAVETPARKKKSKKDKKGADSQEAPNGLGESFEPAPNVKTKFKPLEKATEQLESAENPHESSVDAEEAARLKAEKKKAKKLARKQGKGIA